MFSTKLVFPTNFIFSLNYSLAYNGKYLSICTILKAWNLLL